MTVQALSPNLTDDEIPLFEHLYEMDQYKYSTHTTHTRVTHWHLQHIIIQLLHNISDKIKVNNDKSYPN